MTYRERMHDLEELEQYYNAVDFMGKNRRFFTDIIVYRKEMIEKDKGFIKEGLRYIKPKFAKWTIPVFLALSVVLLSIFLLLTDLTLAGLSQYSYKEIITLMKSVFTVTEGQGLKTLLSMVILMLFGWGCVFLIGLTLYFAFKLLTIPIETIYYINEKRKTKQYLNALDRKLSIEQARKFLLKTNSALKTAKEGINTLCQKHNIDSRLRNRENIPYIKELMEVNKKFDPSIEKICDYIISNDKIKPVIDDDTWCRLLLSYDKDFTYYQRENPWLEKYKSKKQKIWKIVTFIPALPIWFFVWQIKMCFAMLGINKETIERKKYNPDFNPENKFSNFDDEENPFVVEHLQENQPSIDSVRTEYIEAYTLHKQTGGPLVLNLNTSGLSKDQVQQAIIEAESYLDSVGYR